MYSCYILLSFFLTLSAPTGPDSVSSVTLRFGGDVLLAEHYERAVGDKPDLAFRDFDLFKTADVGMVNLECPVTVRGKAARKPFTFRMNPVFLPVLRDAGVGIVNIANNHIHDFGDVGLFDTIRYLDSIGIRHVGAGRNHEAAHQPVVLEVKGLKIGFLGYYGGPEAPHASGKHAGVANRRIELIRRDIQNVREEQEADFIIINLHWGTEKALYPDEWQVSLGREIIDAGAHAVIGHHPHVLQGIEKYKHGVIVYSLGNLVFGGNSRHTYDTALFEMQLGRRGTSYRLIPVHINEWKAVEMTGAAGDSLRMHVEFLSRIFPASIF